MYYQNLRNYIFWKDSFFPDFQYQVIERINPMTDQEDNFNLGKIVLDNNN